jgi:5-hydroxyisourate hydrolase-like protein (transthyretin family)
MKHAARISKAFVFVMLLLGGVLGTVATTLGQGVEVEPNNPCPIAQNFGAVTFPFTVNGSLDSTPESPDVDFFRFTGTPGAVVRVDLEGQATGKGTLNDPFLGFFDAGCNLLASDDDSGIGLNSKLVLAIPADGVLIFGVTRCCDEEFVGGGVGTYQLTITPSSTIGSISGRVVDAQTGEPLAGDTDPFASVQLLRCQNGTCSTVSSQSADAAGRFLFPPAFSPLRLEVGTYRVRASAEQYQQGQTEPFAVAEGENRDVGDIPLQPFPVQISHIVPCENLPAEGGRCQYSMTVTNRLPTPLDAEAWSVVEADGIGSFIDFTQFQVKNVQALDLKSQESRDIQFRFQVPGKVRDGAVICTDVFVGRRPGAFFDTVGRSSLFCITKGPSGFSLASDKETQLNGQTLKPPKGEE